jgi:RNA polymerase sigma-70 factor (ECF subfamily)
MRTPPRRGASAAAGKPAAAPTLSKDSELAGAIKALVLAGDRDAARERFADLVASQQRRALRIAYQYLRDAHDADEAVQDAFVKVFTHITTYREDLPFEVWFTRILVNGCLDMRKSRARRLRWVLPPSASPDTPPPVEQWPDRQRAVFTLCHVAEHSTAEVGQALGLSEATVRVHLFRAVRKLRKLLEPGGTGK